MSSLNSSKSSLPSLFLSNFSKTASICVSVILRDVFRNSALVRYPSLFLSSAEKKYLLIRIMYGREGVSWMNLTPVIRIKGESSLLVQIRRRRCRRCPRTWTRRASPSAKPRPNIHLNKLLEIDATVPILVVAGNGALYPLAVWYKNTLIRCGGFEWIGKGSDKISIIAAETVL